MIWNYDFETVIFQIGTSLPENLESKECIANDGSKALAKSRTNATRTESTNLSRLNEREERMEELLL